MDSKDEIKDNYPVNKLHIKEAPEIGGKFLTVVNNKERKKTIGEFDVSPQVKLYLNALYINARDDITSYELTKLKNGKEDQKVALSNFGLEKIQEFNNLISSLDIKCATDEKIDLGSKVDVQTLLAALNSKVGAKALAEIQKDPSLEQDIIAIAYKREQLAIFKAMLDNKDRWKQYCEDESITDLKEEKAWQHFLQKNQWIFGYGLDYRFRGVLQQEFHASDTDLDGKNSVIGDFLLGDDKFVSFVEIKTPNTVLFGTSKNRSNSWFLSQHLIHAVSQILEQKASGQLKLDNRGFLEDGSNLKQKPVDAKVFLIIGRWDEIQEDDDRTKNTKERTLELFRRDSRNVEIMTFDELYQRAKHIVENFEKESETKKQESLTHEPTF